MVSIQNTQKRSQQKTSQKKYIKDIPVEFFKIRLTGNEIKLANLINRLDIINKNNGCFAKREWFAEKLSVCERTITNYIARLEAIGVIQRKGSRIYGLSMLQQRKKMLLQDPMVPPPGAQPDTSKSYSQSYSQPEKSYSQYSQTGKFDPASLHYKERIIEEKINYKENFKKESSTMGNLTSHNRYYAPLPPSAPKGERSSCDELKIVPLFSDEVEQQTLQFQSLEQQFETQIWRNPLTPDECRNGSKKHAFENWLKITNNGTRNTKEVREGLERYIRCQLTSFSNNLSKLHYKRLEYFLTPSKELWKSEWKPKCTEQQPLPRSFDKRPCDWARPLFKRQYIDKAQFDQHKELCDWQFSTRIFRTACKQALEDGYAWICKRNTFGSVTQWFLGKKADEEAHTQAILNRLLKWQHVWEKCLKPEVIEGFLRSKTLRSHVEDRTYFYWLLRDICDKKERNEQAMKKKDHDFNEEQPLWDFSEETDHNWKYNAILRSDYGPRILADVSPYNQPQVLEMAHNVFKSFMSDEQFDCWKPIAATMEDHTLTLAFSGVFDCVRVRDRYGEEISHLIQKVYPEVSIKYVSHFDFLMAMIPVENN